MSIFFDRRTFIKLVAAGVAASLAPVGGPERAFASSTDSKMIPFSPDIAASFAERFAAGVSPDLPFRISDPVSTYDVEGNFLGYRVGFVYNGVDHGYVMLDHTYTGLVSSYSFNVPEDGEAALFEHSGPAKKSNGIDRLIVLNQLEYGVLDSTEGTVRTNSRRCVPIASKDNVWHRAVDSRDDVLVSFSDAVSKYTVGYGGSVGQYFYQTEANIERALKKYACGPTALFSIGLSMLNASGTAFLIPNNTSWADYSDLWDMTDTTVYKTSGGISYGKTTNSKMGPGFVYFCRKKGKVITSKYLATPSYLTYTGHINNHQHSLIHMGIGNGSSVGHVMSVFGHAQLLKKGQSKPLLNCLEVFTGWSAPSFIIYDPAKHTYVDGTFFND